MTAPHLPPKTNSISWHERFLFVRGALLVVMLALASGATAALVILAWYPEIIGRAVPHYTVISGNTEKSPAATDAGIITQTIKNARVSLYRASDVFKNGTLAWYARDAAVGSGIFVSEDGWLVTTTVAARASTDMRIIDARGVVYTPEKQVHDPVTGLSFIKVKGNGFTVVPFAGSAPHEGDVLYVPGAAALLPYAVGPVQYNQHDALASDHLTRMPGIFGPDAVESTPLFTAQGSLAGFMHTADAHVVIIPASGLDATLGQVFATQKIIAPKVRISYLMIPDVTPLDLASDTQAPRVGAYVTRVQRLPGYTSVMPTLLQGDIITAVNDEPVTVFDDLSFLFLPLRTAHDALLTVYRSGEQIRVPIAF